MTTAVRFMKSLSYITKRSSLLQNSTSLEEPKHELQNKTALITCFLLNIEELYTKENHVSFFFR